MTIEKIKAWRKEDHVNVFTTDFPLNEDDVANIDWLIAEVERLQEAYDEACEDAMQAVNSTRITTAKRCAEIVCEQCYKDREVLLAVKICEEIEKEFGL